MLNTKIWLSPIKQHVLDNIKINGFNKVEEMLFSKFMECLLTPTTFLILRYRIRHSF